jgi:hypothetical protein
MELIYEKPEAKNLVLLFLQASFQVLYFTNKNR